MEEHNNMFHLGAHKNAYENEMMHGWDVQINMYVETK